MFFVPGAQDSAPELSGHSQAEMFTENLEYQSHYPDHSIGLDPIVSDPMTARCIACHGDCPGFGSTIGCGSKIRQNTSIICHNSFKINGVRSLWSSLFLSSPCSLYLFGTPTQWQNIENKVQNQVIKAAGMSLDWVSQESKRSELLCRQLIYLTVVPFSSRSSMLTVTWFIFHNKTHFRQTIG